MSGLWWAARDTPTASVTAASATAVHRPGSQPEPVRGGGEVSAEVTLQDLHEAGFIDGMRERFGPHLHRPHAQVRSLEQLMAYLQAQYPEDWEQRVLPLLQALWPEDAATLFERFTALQGYHEWLRSERERLRALPAADRRAALWAARELAFGADAEAIWAAERRSQALGDALHALPADAPPVAQAAMFRDAVEHIYGEEAVDLLHHRRTELMQGFLARAPVQEALRELPAAGRRAVLREVRTELGMPEEALQRWDALDAQRDARWAAGSQYMAQRTALQDQLGEQSAGAIAQLQREVFGAQADIIAQEEHAGFFRYARPRRIGRE